MPKKCNPKSNKAKQPELYICNPETGRWVKRDGKKGREIIAKYGDLPAVQATEAPKPVKIAAPMKGNKVKPYGPYGDRPRASILLAAYMEAEGLSEEEALEKLKTTALTGWWEGQCNRLTDRHGIPVMSLRGEHADWSEEKCDEYWDDTTHRKLSDEQLHELGYLTEAQRDEQEAKLVTALEMDRK